MANEYNRENVIKAIEDHAKGHIAKHSMNVEVYLKNAAGVGEHPDIRGNRKRTKNYCWIPRSIRSFRKIF